MDEKPKSIWKKSWKGPRGLLLWFVSLTAVAFAIIFSIGCTSTMHHPIGHLLFFSLLYAVCWALAGILVIAFIFWIFCWRNFKRFLFGLACFATLIALFYAEEDWRCWHDWNQYKRDWGAKGEKFDFADFVPPSVPDDQNFAMAPVFDATRKLANRKWRQEHRNPNPDDGAYWNFNLVDPLEIHLVNNDDTWPTNGGGSWQRATLTDLKTWQDYYRALSAKTNLFPVAPQPQTPAQDVLLALSKYGSTVEELRQASLRSDSRFPLDYDDEMPGEILLPHLASLKRCVQLLELRAIAELQNGQSDKALADVKLSLVLAESIRTEPFIISQLVRFACFQITLQAIYQGLAEHDWSDAQLAELDSELAKMDFLAGYEWSVRGERAMHAKVIDWLEQKRSRYWALVDMEGSDRAVMNNFWRTMVFYLMPKGWFEQNKIELARMHQQWSLPAVDDEQQTVSPKKIAQADKAVGAISRPTPFNLFARLLLPALGSYAKRTAQAQTAVDLARVAIALERYRLAHGNYPESLAALAPQFMEKVPHDVIGGGPLHYRREADGQFVLYSSGWNERDDGGVVGYKKGGIVPDYESGDVVWRYPLK